MRSRTLKPGFFTNEQLAECGPLARILFAGLWCVADRAGKLHDRPRKIKAEILPYEAIPDADSLLAELAQHGLITRYEAAGERYIKIPGFEKHQNPHPKESPSEIPEPCNSTANPDLSTASRGKDSTSPAGSSVSPLQDLPSPLSASRGLERPARVGVGHPGFQAVSHWTGVVWPKLSEASCPSVTASQATSLAGLSAKHGADAICAAMDAAAADEFWGPKLDLDTFIAKHGKWLSRKATGPPGKPNDIRVGSAEPAAHEAFGKGGRRVING